LKNKKMNFYLLLLSVFLLLGCEKVTSGGPFIRNLVEEAEKGSNNAPIKFSELTDFDWDTVFVYGPYSSLEEINKKHGTDFWSILEPGYLDEGHCIYIFEKEKKTVRTFKPSRQGLDCSEIVNQGAFSKENAIFEVRYHGDHRYLKWIDPEK